MTLWTVAHQAPLSMGFPRQEYWSGLPFPSPGGTPNPGIPLHLLHWQMDSLPLSRQGSQHKHRRSSQFSWREQSSRNWQRRWYLRCRKGGISLGEMPPPYIFSHSGCLWLIPNWQIRKCKGFLQPGSLACRNLRALCLEQLFIIKKIKMMYCVLYSISRDHEDHNTWNTALPHPTYQ